MKRKAERTEPFFCSPETGCPAEDCEGVPLDSPESHGIHCDEWYFTVVHGRTALTLVVFGTDLHEGIPAWHPARAPSMPLREPRGATLSSCTVDPDPKTDTEPCPHLDAPCKGGGQSYLIAHGFWANAGQDDAKLEQPESFWAGLELFARSWCEDEGCCEDLTEEEDAKLTELVKLPEPRPVSEVELIKMQAFFRGIHSQDLN